MLPEHWLYTLSLRLRSLFHRAQAEQELEDELGEHLERKTEEYVAKGMAAEEARRRARVELGGLEKVKEECRGARRVNWIHDLVQDLRYGVRVLGKSPSFTTVAVLTLALGIGANTAIFSVVDAVLLRSLPYRDASRLVVMNETTPKVGTVSVSYQDFLDWRAQGHSFSQISAVHRVGFNLAGVSEPENVSGAAVSPNFLSMLSVHPFLGRDFAPPEEKPGTAPVVLLSYSLWQSHLGGDPSAIGRTVTLDGRSYTIAGVLPPDFRLADKTDVVEPTGVWATNNPEATERGARGDTVVIGRLAPHISLSEARRELEGIAAQLAREYPASNDQVGVALQPIRNIFVGEMRPALLVLFGAVMFVLLIACANVANLFLVRGAARVKEVALRTVFGASRMRIIRQMLTESSVLALLGGVFGVALAVAGIHGTTELISPTMLAGAALNLNGEVLLFAAGAVVLCAFVFGLAPAIHFTKPDVQSELKEGARTSSAGASQTRLRGALAVAEIAVSLVLLAGAGLMVKSLYRLLSVNPGFRPDRVLTTEMYLRTEQYSTNSAMLNFWQQVLDRVRELPGVESAALGTNVPLTDNHERWDITREGMALLKPGSYPHPDKHVVSPGYARTLGIPLLGGRAFTDADNESAPRVGLINAMIARELFPNEDAIGKRFMFGRFNPAAAKPPEWVTIVGVVGDTKLYGLANAARLEVYVPFRQSPPNDMNLLVKSSVDPAAMTSAIRGVVASVDKDQPIFAISTMGKLVSDDVSTRRITLVLLGLFSGLAVVLAAIGIYGVISYSVAQRTREIGIRMALGAQRRDVMRLVIGQGATIAGIGIVVGIAAALVLTRWMASLLYGVTPSDPATFAGVAILLLIVGLAACYIPTRRAVRVDPMVALRYE